MLHALVQLSLVLFRFGDLTIGNKYDVKPKAGLDHLADLVHRKRPNYRINIISQLIPMHPAQVAATSGRILIGGILARELGETLTVEDAFPEVMYRVQGGLPVPWRANIGLD